MSSATTTTTIPTICETLRMPLGTEGYPIIGNIIDGTDQRGALRHWHALLGTA